MNGSIVKWGVVAFIVWWVIHDPASAALAVQHLGNFATRAATSLATAITSV